MRVALIYRTVSRQGGTERYAWDAARALISAGDEVHTLAHRVEAPLEGAFHHPVGQLPSRYGRTFGFLLRAQQVLARLEAARRFDVVLGLGRTLDQDVLRLGGGCHAAFLEAVRGWPSTAPPPLSLPSLYDKAMLALERRMLRASRLRRIVAVSQRVRAEISGRYDVPADRMTVLYNGVDLERFDAARFPRAREQVREHLGIPISAPVFLFVGSGLERKGAVTLLEAFARLTQRLGHAAPGRAPAGPPHLLLVGRDALATRVRAALQATPGTLRLFLESGMSARVHLLGAQDPVEPFYLAADALVLPTRYEPFGNVCLEALAMGCPVLTTTCNGAHEVLGDEARGLSLEDPRDAEGLEHRMSLLLDPDRRSRLRLEGLAVASRCSLHHHLTLLRGLLLEVASQSRDLSP